MPPTSADHNLLFGMMALQNDMVRQDHLLEAFQLWILNKNRPIQEILVEKGWLKADDASDIARLLEKRVTRAGGEHKLVQQLNVSEDLYATLARVPDPQIQNVILTALGAGDGKFGEKSAVIMNETDEFKTALEADKYKTTPISNPRSESLRSSTTDNSSSATRFMASQFHAKGGMGMVFLAEDQEITRRVALKVMKNTSGNLAPDPFWQSFFLLEGEVTGRLDHPGVVPVYGLGHTSDGKPYYAMKFVDAPTLGKLISEFHRAEALPTRDSGISNQERRKLLDNFRAACNTIQYAHDRGVLHCDLKPENIMTGEYGETFVVDWGMVILSKADGVSSNSTIGFGSKDPIQPKKILRQALHMEQGGERTFVGGTLGYMAPEHYRCHIEKTISQITTACDIFSLGATLYHILAGVPAIEAIKTESQQVKLDRIRDCRYERPRSVNPKIPKALEAICLKAMSAQPENRYDSARALAEDIEKWLADEPISTYKEPLADQLRRWARKNRTAVGIAASALMLLSFGAVFYGLLQWKYNQELEQKNREIVEANVKANSNAEEAKRERIKAEENATVAREQEAVAVRNQKTSDYTTAFMVDLFKASDPIGMEGLRFRNYDKKQTDIKAKDVLDRGLERIDTEFKSDPLIRARILRAIGQSYRELSDFKSAEKLLLENLSIQEKSKSDRINDLMDANTQLGLLYHYWAKYDLAEPYYLKAVEMTQRLTDEFADSIRAKLYFYVGWFYADQIETKKAEKMFRESLSIYQAILKKENSINIHREMTIARLGLSASLFDSDQNIQGFKELLAAAPTLFRKGTENNINAVGAFQGGLLASRMNLNAKAEERYRKALEYSEKGIGLDHPYVAFVFFQLAEALSKQNKLVESEIYFKKTLELVRNSVGLNHPRAVYVVRSYANLLEKLDRTKQADELYDELISTRIQAFGENSVRTADAYATRSFDYYDRLDERSGDQLLQKAMDIYERNPEKRTFIIDLVFNKYSWRCFERNEYQKAIGYFEKTNRMLQEHQAQNPEFDIERKIAIAFSNAKLGHFEQSLKQSFENLAVVKKSKDKSLHPWTLSTIGMVYYEEADWKKALDYYLQAYQLVKAGLGASHQDSISYQETLVTLQSELGNHQSAVEAWESIDAIRTTNATKIKGKIPLSHLSTGIKVYLENKDEIKAIGLWKQMIGLYQSDMSNETRSSVLSSMALLPSRALEAVKPQAVSFLQTAESSPDTTKTSQNRILIALSWYRLGENEKALSLISKIKPEPGTDLEALTWIVESLIQKKSGETVKANESGSRSKAWFSKNATAKTDQNLLKYNWSQRTAFRLLLQEL